MSLPDATSIQSSFGADVRGYNFESDSTVGDYWIGSSQTLDGFLAEMQSKAGTQPEVVGAYVDPDQFESGVQARSAQTYVLETGLPEFAASPGAPSDEFTETTGEGELGTTSKVGSDAMALDTPAGRWDPYMAEVQIRDMGTFVNIVEKYTWGGPLHPYDNIYNMPDHWGVEFTVDFWTTNKGAPSVQGSNTGIRPSCGVSNDGYKDWAAASNREFNWFAMVIDGSDMVYAPGQIGFYGDYNDLFDECERSSVSAGMAQPYAMPYSIAGSNDVYLALYPDRGQDATSVIDGNVHAVERSTCEAFPTITLTDCMGANYATTFPSGAPLRTTLAASRGWTAPNKCWYSDDWGSTAPIPWECSSGDD